MKKGKLSVDNLEKLHSFSYDNKESIGKSNECGCFYCLKSFKASEVKKYIIQDSTALCPNCGFDSVLGDVSGFAVTDAKLLKQMREYYFG